MTEYRALYTVNFGNPPKLVRKNSNCLYPWDFLNEESVGNLIKAYKLKSNQEVEVVIRPVDTDG